MNPIDLRSDTVTQPSPGMRQAMANAPVGDDVYREDPTVRALEAATSELLGKADALFVPSGTMANQLALLAQTRPGELVMVGHSAHIAWHEAGAGGAFAGVQFKVVGTAFDFGPSELEAALELESPYSPKPSLVCLENTHNLAGGRVFSESLVSGIAKLATARGLKLHLDGARLWHAAEKTGAPLAQLAAPFDSVNVCFSKGLGAPIGSALLGSVELVTEARRFRKMLGGGMRQAGIIAAGALYALRHQRADLARDHENAGKIASILSQAGLALVAPETNIVVLEVPERAERLVALCAEAGVLVHRIGQHRVRLVLHRDVSPSDTELAARKISACFAELQREAHT